MLEHLKWDRDGRDWPHREASAFVNAAGMRWHVQRMGAGPEILLVHGTGASTHSWRGLMPILADHYSVIAVDLPGHGFTSAVSGYRLSLPGMADALAELVEELGAAPVLGVGHSAGAAILVQMTLKDGHSLKGIVSLNGALFPFGGVAGQLFSPMAKFCAAGSLIPWFFASRAAKPSVLQRLIRETGSTLDAEGMALYGRLASNSGHVSAAFGMMANWDLRPLEPELRRLPIPLVLVTGSNDRTVSPSHSRQVHRLVPDAELISLSGLGHLAHEEDPAAVAAIVDALAARLGIAASP